MKVHKDNPSLARLYFEAERRNLEYHLTGTDSMLVSSASRPGIVWHRVELCGDEIECFCESKVPQCTHAALAAAHWFPVTCWLKFEQEADEIRLIKNLKKLSKIRERESRKTEKLPEALMPERKAA
jgi:hypothetical protein